MNTWVALGLGLIMSLVCSIVFEWDQFQVLAMTYLFAIFVTQADDHLAGKAYREKK